MSLTDHTRIVTVAVFLSSYISDAICHVQRHIPVFEKGIIKITVEYSTSNYTTGPLFPDRLT